MTKAVRQQSAAVTAQARHWPIIAALQGGTASMRDSGEQYLPKWPNEDAESYTARLATATLYPAFARTVEVMAAKPFSRPLTLADNVPKRMVEWLNDCDLKGHNLHVFAGQLSRDVVAYGISGVLVDYPKVSNIKTQAEEKAIAARPYFTRYAPGTVIGWKTTIISGYEKLTQLRLLETVTEDDGDFGEKVVEQVRVLYPGRWEVWRKEDKKEDWSVFEDGVTTLNEIPFVFFYGIRKDTGIGLPPLVELAYQNVEHWQSSSDQQTILHVARVPILTIIGADDNTSITVGSKSAVKIPMNGDMKFVEHSGSAIEAGRKSILDLEERMRQTGAELLVLKPGDVTATQVTSEDQANRCTLQRIAEDMEDALDQCLQYMADWVGEAEGGNVAVFKDFGAATLAEASAELLLKTNQAGKLSDETYFNELKRRGIYAPDSTWDDEKERIDGQGAALGMMEEPPTPPDPVDLSPVLTAIEGISVPEPVAYDDTAIKQSLADLSQQVTELSAKTDEPQTAEIDMSAFDQGITEVKQAVADLSAKVAEIETDPDDTEDIRAAITELIRPLSEQVAALSAKPEAPEVDLSSINARIDALTQLINTPKPQSQQSIITDQQRQVKKQITITRDANGAITGAEITPHTVQ